MYDATLGRFLERDPIGDWADASNHGDAYEYGGDSPTTVVDPFGLRRWRFVVSFTDDFVTNVAAVAQNVYNYGVFDTTGGVDEMVAGILKRFNDEKKFDPKGVHCIESIELTGHGGPGSWSNRLQLEELTDPRNAFYKRRALLEKLKPLWCKANEGMTLRMCETAKDQRGRDFLAALAVTVGANVKGWTGVYEIHPTGAELTATPAGTVSMTGDTGRRSIMEMYRNMSTTQIILTSPGSAAMWAMRAIGF